MGAHRRLGNRSPLGQRVAAAAFSVLIIATLALPALAATLTLDPSVASPGQQVAVHGNQFETVAIITISFDGAPVGIEVNANPGGAFDTSFQVPAGAEPGDHVVTASSALNVATATLTVPPPPTTTPPTTTTVPTTTTTTTVLTTTTTTTVPTTTTTIPTTTTTTPSTTTSPPTTSTTSLTTTTTTLTTTTAEPTTTTRPDPTTGTPEDATTTTSTIEDGSTTTTAPPVTTAITLPFTGTGWAFGAVSGDEAPEMAGSVLAVGQFSLRPGAGPAGSVVEFVFDLNQALPGLDTLHLSIAGEPIGDPVDAAGGSVTVKRTIPDLPPGSYQVTVAHDGVELASAPFEVTERLGAAVPTNGTRAWLALPLLAIIVVLAWRTIRDVRDALPPGSRLGPVAAWRVRRGRNPLG
ncbi:MAG: hypothetical protein ACRDVD_04410 [Acidimicrobiia bacterium]